MKKMLLAALLGLAFSNANAGVSWLADANGALKVTQTIVDNGNSTYTYNFDITNQAETAPIWWLLVYTNTPILSSTAVSSNTGWASYGGTPPSDVDAPEGQSDMAWTYSAADGWPNSAVHGIALGQTATGFSFTSSVYDNSALRFVADRQGDWGGTNLGHNASGDQIFSYGGMTVAAVPEPETYAMFAMGLGLAGWAARRRKAA